MELSGEDYSILEDCGRLNYPPGKIIRLLKISDADAFLEEFNDEESEISLAYEYGKSTGEYTSDMKILKKSEEGDADFLSLGDKRRYFRRIDQLKKELFNI